jgi:hypothetical protein
MAGNLCWIREDDGTVIVADDRPLLERIASQVKPIMVKRNWTVGTLGEVLPLLFF